MFGGDFAVRLAYIFLRTPDCGQPSLVASFHTDLVTWRVTLRETITATGPLIHSGYLEREQRLREHGINLCFLVITQVLSLEEAAIRVKALHGVEVEVLDVLAHPQILGCFLASLF